MNTLELQGRLMKLIANTEDKSLLEKMEAYFLSLVSKKESSMESKETMEIPEWHKEVVRKRVAESKDSDFITLEQAFKKIKLD